jgi:hypothetical protein
VGALAAVTAAQAPFHKRVILIDAPTASGTLQSPSGQDLSLGGPTGLFSKALRDTSKRIKVSTLRGMGLREDSVWNEIINSCVDLAASNSEDIERQLDMAGVTFLQGFAAFADSGGTDNLVVSQKDGSSSIVKAERVLLATGSQPFRPGGVPFDGKRVFDSDSINGLSYLPKSVAITGSGIIAVEFAKIFRNLGADVTLIIRDQVPRNALMKIGLDKEYVSEKEKCGTMLRSGSHNDPAFSSPLVTVLQLHWWRTSLGPEFISSAVHKRLTLKSRLVATVHPFALRSKPRAGVRGHRVYAPNSNAMPTWLLWAANQTQAF